uniref:Acetoacetyl-CoA synthetase n=1 Tax=Astyanax mexicanus TaxID=7994 RepID=A0A8B9K9M1_ASTMX
VRPVLISNTHSLQSLHTILSTGSPLKPQSYDYVYRCIKNDVLLGSISGGTDIVSCFMGQNFTVPVYRGEIQSRNLGMAVEAWSYEGKYQSFCPVVFPLFCPPTVTDTAVSRVRSETLVSSPGLCHGLNPEGLKQKVLHWNRFCLVLFASVPECQAVEAFEEVSDSVCVPQYNSDGEERVILFVKMVPGREFSAELVGKIRTSIRAALSARHVPALILQTRDIPYTISGKKVEVAVKQVIAGKEVTQRGAFSNPDSLDLYKNIPELQGF